MKTTETSAKGHTPGPWRVKSTNRSASLEIIGGEHYHHVCALDGKRTESHFHAQESNARLIASAPAMFELLTDIGQWLEIGLSRGEINRGTANRGGDLVSQIRSLITQAKGTK